MTDTWCNFAGSCYGIRKWEVAAGRDGDFLPTFLTKWQGAYPAKLSAADRAGHVVAATILLNATAAAWARLRVVPHPLRGILFVFLPHVCKDFTPLHCL